MEYKDYYSIMGVERDATQDEIKRAYRKLARKYHPDVSSEPEAEAKFKDVGEAYEVLRDPEKRAAYDELGRNWQAGQDFHPPPGWDAGFEFTGAPGGRPRGGPGEYGYSDFFEELFGRAQAAGSGPRRSANLQGEDHHARVQIELEDSFHGATRTITLRVPELTPDGHVQARTRNLKVRIPRGVRPGQQIRLAGQGGPGLGSAPSGDLYLEVEFRPHKRYRLDGADLYLDLPIAPWEAVLGATVRVPTPGGTVDLTIPPGSQTGKRLRLKGRGLPTKPAGDLYVELKIVVPQAGTAEAKEAWETLSRQADFNPRARLEEDNA
ncbi:DnaJ C-terminal domain-containing protein [Elongatibacter sediminis]|uniref:DnaJ C-terminal domain-containing protein n=1 Tax=Elongatibacter sediminis TaxID=3119006 RepID=A0AAW9RIU6_9GAMM